MGGAAAVPAGPSGELLSRRPAPRPVGRAYVDDVGRVVLAIPEGMALTYGDVAELTGWGAARAVGAVMHRYGDELPWWRVVRADGSLPGPLVAQARQHWEREGHPLLPGGDRLDLQRCRWDGPDGLSEVRGTVGA